MNGEIYTKNSDINKAPSRRNPMAEMIKNHLLITFSSQDIYDLCTGKGVKLTLESNLEKGGQVSITLDRTIPHHENTPTSYGTGGFYVTIPSRWGEQFSKFLIIPLEEKTEAPASTEKNSNSEGGNQ